MAELSKFFVTIGSKFDATGLSKARSQFNLLAKVVGGVAVAIGTKAVLSAAKFQAQLSEVATMLDKNSRSLLPGYKKELLALAVKFGETTETLSKGLYDILSAGIDSSKAMGVLKASALAAKAGLTETGIAADAITTIINSYGLEAEQAGEVSDWFFSIVKRGKTTFNELAPVIGQVSSLAATSGLSMDEMGAALATMTKSGIKTNEAITSLRGVLTAFLKPTTEGKKAAAELGVELSTTTLKTEGLIPTLKKLEGATDSQVATIFGNVRALSGLATILKDTEVFYSDLDVMVNKAGASQEAFAINTDNVAFKFSQLQAAGNKLFISIGDELLPTVEDITSALIFFTDELSENEDALSGVNAIMKNVTKAGMGVAAVFELAGTALATLMTLLPRTKEEMTDLVGAMGGNVIAMFRFAKTTKDKLGDVKLGWEEMGTIIEKYGKLFEKMNKDKDKVHGDTEADMTKDTKKNIKKRIAADQEEVEVKRSLVSEWIEEQRFMSEEYAVWQKEQKEIQLEEFKVDIQAKLDTIQTFTNATMDIVNGFYDLQAQNIDNDLQKSLDAETTRYENRKAWINANIKDEQKRNQMLDELEEGHAATTENLRNEAERQEKKLKKKMKAFQIAEAIINTAVGATKAWATAGPFGAPLAAMVTAAGMLKVALIRAQKFQKGAFVTGATPAIFGEAGPEIALPLTSPEAINALSKALATAGGTGVTYYITVPPITTRSHARKMGDIIGNEIIKKVKRSRKV